MKQETIFKLHHIGACYRKRTSLPWKDNKFWALHDVSFDVGAGQTVGIIGRNGAGKSTLLKILAGIIMPDRGTICRRADVTVTMQSVGAGFDDRLTGRQNIFLSGLLLGMDKPSIANRVDDIVRLADIGEFIDEPIKHYSSGMRSRLGFAIAYHVDTDVILIDEVLAAGDQAFREKSSELLKEKIKSDRTVVLVSHDIPKVSELCDRVIHIEKGHSLEELSVEASIDRYLETQKEK